MSPEHDEIERSVAAYVLDACDEDEREMVRAHVAGCLSCQRLMRRLDEAVAALPLASKRVRPPARLRERILAAATANGPVQGDEEEPPSRRLLPLPRPRSPLGPRRPSVRLLGAAVAAMAVGLAVLGAWNVLLNRQATEPPAHYALTGTGSMASAGGTVTSYGRDGVTVASFTGMPALPQGEIYELWLIDAGGRPTPGTVFTPRPDGTAQVLLPRTLRDVRQVVVTAEPGPRGAAAPSRKPELASPSGG